jgi:hypothetical protein
LPATIEKIKEKLNNAIRKKMEEEKQQIISR